MPKSADWSVVNPRELSREVTLEVTHKLRQFWCILAAEQEMKVVAEEDLVVQLDRLSMNM